jgi:hypothetical protein
MRFYGTMRHGSRPLCARLQSFSAIAAHPESRYLFNAKLDGVGEAVAAASVLQS